MAVKNESPHLTHICRLHARTSFFKEVTVKSLDSHRIRTLLGARAQLVGIRTDLKNQVRSVLKTFGFMVSQSIEKGFEAKVRGTIKDQSAAAQDGRTLDGSATDRSGTGRCTGRAARGITPRHDKICSHLMTIPGIGVVTSVAFTAAVDDPKRFKNSRSVGAYFGLTSKRYQSGEVDYSGRISKCGDKLVRSYLYEAAGALLTRTKKWSALKSWGLRIAKRSGMSKAKVAVARKLAVIMHQMWLTGEAFRWSEPDAVAA